ncbi:MAG: DegT/DnrJ/EryC1/StrS family aminotransferase, partial [Trueperaceae bacterium]|nr:DegT/DnrJ/EryC1/StrS family aminotransferase [Trueperaceae bacterium]
MNDPSAPAPVAMLDLAGEVADHEAVLLDAVTRVLRSGQFVGGPEVDAFERAVADRLDVPHAIGVNSGTDALRIALEAAGIGPGDEVVTSPFSFIATAEAIARVGATPRFADVDPDTLNLDPGAAAALVTPRTRALLPVHLFGLPADAAALRDLARDHDLFLLEDAAQAFGAHYPARCAGCSDAPRCRAASRDALAGRAVGALGDAAAFSFYPTKTLGAYGDAGL